MPSVSKILVCLEVTAFIALFPTLYIALVFMLRLFGCNALTAKWISVGVLIANCLSVCSLYLLSLGRNAQLIKLNVTDQSAVGVAMYWAMLFSINFVVMPFLYWLDKRKAYKQGETRIPESVLHFFAYAGGGAGAYASQRFFCHKTVKQSFRKVFRVTLVCSVLIYSISIYLLMYGTDGFKTILVDIDKILRYMN